MRKLFNLARFELNKTVSKLGDLYKDLFAEYKKGKKPGVAQKEFNELWANAKQKYTTKEEFMKWANDLLLDYRRKQSKEVFEYPLLLF